MNSLNDSWRGLNNLDDHVYERERAGVDTGARTSTSTTGAGKGKGMGKSPSCSTYVDGRRIRKLKSFPARDGLVTVRDPTTSIIFTPASSAMSESVGALARCRPHDAGTGNHDHDHDHDRDGDDLPRSLRR